MSFTFSVEVAPGVTFQVTEEEFDAALVSYEKFVKGDPKWLGERVLASGGRGDDSVLPVRVVGGQLDQPERDLDAAEARVRRTLNDEGDATESGDADPWTRGAEGDPAPEIETDPWKGTPVTPRPSAGRTGPSRGTSGGQHRVPNRRERPPVEDQGPGDTYTTYDNFRNQYLINSPNAPQCSCGDGSIAALVTRKSKKDGKSYKVYNCAKGAGDDWKNKCDYWKFPNEIEN
jgi:hypothetical protein